MSQDATTSSPETLPKDPSPSAPSASKGSSPGGMLGRLLKVEKPEKTRGSETASMKSGGGDSQSQPGKPGGFRALMMMKKKMSKWKLGRHRAWSIGGSSMQGEKLAGRSLALENTFQLEPRTKTKFNTERVREVIAETIQFYFTKMESYHAGKCAQMSRYIAEEIKGKVKELGFQRYKLVCQVLIGQKTDQNMHVASRSVWDTENDNVASYIFYKNNIYVVGLVFGTYFE